MSTPILNKVRDRLLFLSPTVQAGWEPESKKEDFDELKTIGQGAFGVVKRVVHKKTQITYASKVIQKQMLKQTNMEDQMKNEVLIMYKLNHPYILKLFNHFEDDFSIHLILEFAPGGQLYSVLWKQPQKRFNEKIAAKFILQLVLSLEHIHTLGIIHRDIKPENLLLDDQGNIRLADFGWSNFFKPDVPRQTFCGTLDYLAPEMLDRTHKHDHTVDIWSVGVLLYELLTGMSPFSPRENQNNQAYVDTKTRENIKFVKYSFTKDFPEGAKDLIDKILVKDPKSRYTCEQIRNHPFIKENTKDVKIPMSITMELEKKKIVKSSEIENMKQEGKLAFTKDEIYQFSRPDSIINKENVKQDDSKTKGLNDALLSKVSEYEVKFNEMDLKLKQYQNENQDLKSKLEQFRLQNNDSSQLQNKLKVSEDHLAQANNKVDQLVNKNLQIQKQLVDLQMKYEEQEDQIQKLKQKTNSQKDEIKQLKQDNQASLSTSQSSKKFEGTSHYESNNVNDLISQLKMKREQFGNYQS